MASGRKGVKTISSKLKQDISIGANLRRLRINAGFSQENLAARLQLLGLPVSREIISQMELGRYSVRVSVLVALKELYHVSFDEFFAGLALGEQRVYDQASPGGPKAIR